MPLHMLHVAEPQSPSANLHFHAMSRHGAKIACLKQLNPILPPALQDGLAERMLRHLFGARRQLEEFTIGQTVKRHEIRHLRLALGERSRLVENDGIQLVGCLQ